MGSVRANQGSVSEADMPAAWDSIATDLELSIDSEYATGNGELLVEYTTGMAIRVVEFSSWGDKIRKILA